MFEVVSGDYVLGQPFFREYKVVFDYVTNQVGVIGPKTDSPITDVDMTPSAVDSNYATTTLTQDNTNNIITGEIGLGETGSLKSSKVAFDTYQ